jgi:hypothetical protein
VCDRYEVHGYRFGLRTTSEAFAGWIRYALAAYRTEATLDEEEDDPMYSVVVEDWSRGEDRVGRRYNILYLGTWGLARTLDLRFLARCLLRQIDSIGHHGRDDAVFLGVGVVDVAGAPSLIPAYLARALCGARRRAERRGVYAPGGIGAALDLRTGELIAPSLRLEVPADALDRLPSFLPDNSNGDLDRFPVEEGERRVVRAVIDIGVGQDALVAERTRPGAVVDLAVTVRNMAVLRGRAIRSIVEAVSDARTATISWSNTNEMIEAIALAGRVTAPSGDATPPAVPEIRPGVDEQRRAHP